MSEAAQGPDQASEQDTTQQGKRTVSYTLETQVTQATGSVLLSGAALPLRLALMRRQRDQENEAEAGAAVEAGAALISYSARFPFDALDRLPLEGLRKLLKKNRLHLLPGLTPALTLATAQGSQQLGRLGIPKYSGVSALCCLDSEGLVEGLASLRQAAAEGSAARGGVLVLAADPMMEASAPASPGEAKHAPLRQGAPVFKAAEIPVLMPADVQELHDLAVRGWDMARASGSWIGFALSAAEINGARSLTLPEPPPEDGDDEAPALPPGHAIALPHRRASDDSGGESPAQPLGTPAAPAAYLPAKTGAGAGAGAGVGAEASAEGDDSGTPTRSDAASGPSLAADDPALRHLHVSTPAVRQRLATVLAHVRAANLDGIVLGAAQEPPGKGGLFSSRTTARRRLGLVAAGRAYTLLREALALLGIDESEARAMGLCVYKVTLAWPLDTDRLHEFAAGLDELIVVEEGEPLLEAQIKAAYYEQPAEQRPHVSGRLDAGEAPFLSGQEALTQTTLAQTLGPRLARLQGADRLARRLPGLLRQAEQRLKPTALVTVTDPAPVTAHPCPGCPFNVGADLPPAGIETTTRGCYRLAQDQGLVGSRDAEAGTDGGEGVDGGGSAPPSACLGADWFGQAPFRHSRGVGHVFVPMAEAAYLAGGSLAVRAAVAQGVSVTFKILLNGRADWGDTPAPAALTARKLAWQLHGEGLTHIIVVSEHHEAEAMTLPGPLRRLGPIPGLRESLSGLVPGFMPWPPGVQVMPRRALIQAEEQLQDLVGVSALILDDRCALETLDKRRPVKPDPAAPLPPEPPGRFVVINELVCEGCGDCSRRSRCLAIQPVATEFGTKRVIDLDACSNDMECLSGYCPAFVVVSGVTRKPRPVVAPDNATLPGKGGTWPQPTAPEPPVLEEGGAPWSVLLAGRDRQDLVALAELLSLAAESEGKAAAWVELSRESARRSGLVLLSWQIAATPSDLRSPGLDAGTACLLLATDPALAGQAAVLRALAAEDGRAVVEAALQPEVAFLDDPDALPRTESLLAPLWAHLGSQEAALVLPGREMAEELCGGKRLVPTGLVLAGAAVQKGWLPLAPEGLAQIVAKLNIAPEARRAALGWGRRAAERLEAVQRLLRDRRASLPVGLAGGPIAQGLDAVVQRRGEELTRSRGKETASRFEEMVQRVARAEQARGGALSGLAEAVARAYFRLLCFKDPIEVARLFADRRFLLELERNFNGTPRLTYHLAPSWPHRRRKETPADAAPRWRQKRRFGPWMQTLLDQLPALRRFRGSRFDPFARSPEVQLDRALIQEFEGVVADILSHLTRDNHAQAIALVRIFEQVRGFGPVKMEAVEAMRARKEERLAAFHAAAHPAALEDKREEG